jgi:SAM-dependent methyltransferase
MRGNFGITSKSLFGKNRQNGEISRLNFFMQPWYQSWFNSPYYHLLYKNRDNNEAEFFITNLLKELKLPAGCNVVDIACGKGRHSVFLNGQGFVVTGIDLSKESIKYCRQFENDTLEFYEHDMREIFRTNYFDAAFNLFTSFGYFEKEHDNLLALRSAAVSLKPKGFLVLDYFNSEKVKAGLPNTFTKEVNDIHFNFTKTIEDNKVVKQIKVNDSGMEFLFTESVSLLTLTDFEKLFAACGLKLKTVFGSYQLQPYSEEKSERLILVGVK